jgi:hypothetical protein
MAATTLLSDNGASSGITGYQLTGGNDGTLQLQTSTSGGTATTAMTINTSQNVGIGTTSPDAKLTIKNPSVTGEQTVLDVHGATNTTKLFYTSVNQTTDVVNVGTGYGAPLAFVTNSTEQMRITSAGNVGIGTSSPSYRLQLVNSASSTVIGIDNAGDNSGAGTAFLGSNTNKNWFIGNQYNVNGGLEFTRSTANGGSTFTTPDVVITPTGEFLIGGLTTYISGQPGSTLQATTNVSNQTCVIQNTYTGNPYGILVTYPAAAPNNTGAEFLYCKDSSTQRMAIRSNGGIANYSANNANLSDERTKTEIQDAGCYLAKICAIPVRTFKYKDQTDDELNLGVIAQEVEAVAPELVDVSGFGETPEDGVPLKAIYQTDLQYALMKCIQEQQAIIEQLRADVAQLKGA